MSVVDLRSLQRQFLNAHIKQGGTVIDFTMGNGHDTAWLADAVGEDGHVYAFDIQEQAVNNTKARLAERGLLARCTLYCTSHEYVLDYVREPICVGVFNLGWLPGSDKTLRTHHASTRKAVEGAISLCAHDGIILIAVYPGHEEGEIEGEMLTEFLATLDKQLYSVSKFRLINSPTAPYFFAVEKV